jgi:hypothetical protein
MANDEKDRHVLAAAAQIEAPVIVSFNLRHFRSEHLEPWGLIEIFRQEESAVMMKLEQQGADRRRTFGNFSIF